MVVIVGVWIIFNAAFAAGMRSKNFPVSPHTCLLFESVGKGAGYIAAQSFTPPKVQIEMRQKKK
jgi:hypothetical protein